MTKPKLTFSFCGTDEKGRARLGDFISVLGSLSALAREIDKETSGSKNGTFYFVITELSFSSPYRIALEPRPYKEDKQMNLSAITQTFSKLKEIEKSNGHKHSLEFLETAQTFLEHLETKITNTNIAYEDNTLDFTPALKAKVNLALEPSEKYEGSARGVLEYFNIHDQNQFRIYSPVEPRKLKCIFPDKLKDKAIAAVGKKIEVKGIMIHRASADYPSELEVMDIEIFPEDDKLPTLDDLIASLPPLKLDCPSEEFVREMRDANKT